jgi:ribosomal protein L11 methylase PrmA
MITSSNPRLAASFRDPSGFLFVYAGTLYRQVNQVYQENYAQLFASGLYAKLVKKGWLIPHEEVDIAPPQPETAFEVIRPEKVAFISYPYEWSFSQLKDAALLTLKIQKLALQHGQSLKDSSAYNIQFRNGRPVLIDTLSFEVYPEGQPWTAYRQFCQHFLAPLALMAHTDVRLSQLMRVYIDGVPLDLASNLLPGRTKFNLGLQTHIHLHARTQQRYADKTVNKEQYARSINKTQLLGLIETLEGAVRKLAWKPAGTEWGEYYQDTNYSDAAMRHKQALVEQYIDQIAPQSVWDLGANTGVFSRIASQKGIPTLSFDIDPAAVEQNYRTLKQNKEANLLPLVLDLTNPSPAIGWHNQERESLLQRAPADALLALALIHHLAISNNVPLPVLAQFFADLGRWLVIEFVPKSDSQVQRLLATRADIFPDYNFEDFEKIFGEVYDIRAVEPVEGTERRLYLMEKK